MPCRPARRVVIDVACHLGRSQAVSAGWLVLKQHPLTWCDRKRIYEYYGSIEALFSVGRGDEWLEAPENVRRALAEATRSG